MSRRPRIGLVTPSFRLFDEQMPASFRAGLVDRAERFRAVLASEFEVAHWGLVSDSRDAGEANEHLKAGRIEVIVVAPTMAAPPGYSEDATSGLDAPTVIWNTATTKRLPDGLDQAAAHEDTALLGALMFANTMVRSGTAPIVVSASPEDPVQVRRVRETVRAAAAAVALRRANVIRIGDPIPGYTNVLATGDELATLGVTEHSVGIDELADEFAAAGRGAAGEISARIAELGWTGDADRRSRRLAAAIRRLVDSLDADCGTVNCHGPWFRSSPDIGIVGCLGVSLCAASGVPISCTGDLPTALAMKLARDIAGASLYCEIFAFESETGLALLANSGEGDPATGNGTPHMEPTQYYPGRHGRGTALSFPITSGPVTLVSLTPTDRTWRLACATGEIVESRYPGLGAPNGMFRFDGGGTAAIDRWLAAGPVHHHALAPGRIAEPLTVAARVLGAEYMAV